jgi:hypothetical protein
MRNYGKPRFSIVVLSIVVFPLIILVAPLSSACTGSTPQDREIPVRLTGGRLDPGTIRVGQNDSVTLNLESDQPGTLHLHGYDLEQEVKAGEVTGFMFVADASGRFRIAFHAAGEDHQESGHGEVFESAILQPGDSFSIVATPEMEGTVISYHGHLHPEIIGSVGVAADAPAADTAMVEIRDGDSDLPEVVVRPGTTIIWSNHSSEIQVLDSADHVEIMEDFPGAPGHPEESTDPGHSHAEGSEVEEIEVGFLEVQPR